MENTTPKTNQVLSVEEFFKLSEVQKQFVKLTKDGRGFWVYGLSSDERDHYEMKILTQDGKPRDDQLRASLVAVCVRDENGLRIFNDESDVIKLGKKSAHIIQKLFAVAQRLSGMTAQDMDDLKGN